MLLIENIDTNETNIDKIIDAKYDEDGKFSLSNDFLMLQIKDKWDHKNLSKLLPIKGYNQCNICI